MSAIRLVSGTYSLTFPSNDAGYSLAITGNDRLLYTAETPCYVFIKKHDAFPASYASAYLQVTKEGDTAIAYGETTTGAGSVIAFTDRYRAIEGGTFSLDRHVEVLKAETTLEWGLATKFYVQPAASLTLEDVNCFAPGVWYLKNEYVPQHFMGYQKQIRYHWMYETQYALPMFAMQNPQDGHAICLSRPRADVTLRDMNTRLQPLLVDESLTMGGLGVSTADGLSLDYLYPCGKGTTTRPLPSGFAKEPEYLNHFHPLRVGYADTYSVMIDLLQETDYPTLMQYYWRRIYDRIAEPIVELDNELLYKNCMELLKAETRSYANNAWGLPFSTSLPSCSPMNVAFQMGFVGQQPNIGYQLIRYGILSGDEEALLKGRGIISFWASTSLSDFGAPRIWYTPGTSCYEDRPFWVRMIGDGLEGILDAYVLLKKQGEDHPDWLEYCSQVGNWLCRVQNADGSWYRSYDKQGEMLMDSKANTSNVIRFLVQLHLVTGDEKYRTAALQAGTWCLMNITAKLEYRGGTCDNSDILDNESGIYAMFAYLSLYDLTKEECWMDALKTAADYTETWTYAWSFPVYVPFPNNPLSKRNISGQSLIATGHSGADVYMAACPYIYYRLYLYTEDPHYLHFARFLHKNSKQCTDYDGSFGYAYPGLCHESSGLFDQTFTGVYHWLPWCTYVQVDPISRMLDTFGVYEIDDAEKLDRDWLRQANDIYTHYAP